MQIPKHFVITNEIGRALKRNEPVVALESAVITHGLPYPENLNLARDVEAEIRKMGVIPATIGLLDGKVHIGLEDNELIKLATPNNNQRKISRRDFAIAVANKECGGTTVAATLFAAHSAGIRIFSTGGIGGVHRAAPFDVSADLPELGNTPLIVVCAGAKAILDLPATLEYLETMGVPVLGYQTDEFPAFYSRQSGLPVTLKVNSPQEIAMIARAQWEMGLKSALLVAQPPPIESALDNQEMESVISTALKEAQKEHISGAKVTPFLLSKVSELSKGESLHSNLDLLLNNARLAARIALELSVPTGLKQG
jgi:pseudouridine-5'-phosphate glycosidase